MFFKPITNLCVCMIFIVNSTFSEDYSGKQEAISGHQDTNSIIDLINIEKDDIDLAYRSLQIAQDDDPSVDIDKYLNILDTMTDELKAKLDLDLMSPRQMLNGITFYLFYEKGFTNSLKKHDVTGFSLDKVLERKEGNCLTLSLLYTIIGQRLDLPIKIVFCGFSPMHTFVQYESEDLCVYIETTDKGKNYDNLNYWVESYKKDNVDKIFVSNNRETLGVVFFNYVMYLRTQKQVEKYNELLPYVIVLNPNILYSELGLMLVLKYYEDEDQWLHIKEPMRLDINEDLIPEIMPHGDIKPGMLPKELEVEILKKIDEIFQSNFEKDVKGGPELDDALLENIETIISNHTTNTTSLIELGDTLLDRGYTNTAIHAYEHVIKLEPDNDIANAKLESLNDFDFN